MHLLAGAVEGDNASENEILTELPTAKQNNVDEQSKKVSIIFIASYYSLTVCL